MDHDRDTVSRTYSDDSVFKCKIKPQKKARHKIDDSNDVQSSKTMLNYTLNVKKGEPGIIGKRVEIK